jgi:hypothetical protein
LGDVPFGGAPDQPDWLATWDVADWVAPVELGGRCFPGVDCYPVDELWFVVATAGAGGFAGAAVAEVVERALADSPRAVVCGGPTSPRWRASVGTSRTGPGYRWS